MKKIICTYQFSLIMLLCSSAIYASQKESAATEVIDQSTPLGKDIYAQLATMPTSSRRSDSVARLNAMLRECSKLKKIFSSMEENERQETAENRQMILMYRNWYGNLPISIKDVFLTHQTDDAAKKFNDKIAKLHEKGEQCPEFAFLTKYCTSIKVQNSYVFAFKENAKQLDKYGKQLKVGIQELENSFKNCSSTVQNAIAAILTQRNIITFKDLTDTV